MKWITRLLGLLLAVTLTATAIAWVSEATVWNKDYVRQTARDSGLYTGVAKRLPDVLVPGTTGDQSYLLRQLISPALVQAHLDDLIGGLEDYYRNGGTPPTLDLSDVRSQFEALGLTPPPLLATLTDTPRTISNPALDSLAMRASRQSGDLKWLGPLTALVLAAAIFIVARRRRWTVLGGAGFTAAIMTALASGIVLLLPSLTTSGIATSAWAKLAEPVRAVADAIARDASKQLLWWAVGLALFGVLMGLAGLGAAASAKFRHNSKDQPPVE